MAIAASFWVGLTGECPGLLYRPIKHSKSGFIKEVHCKVIGRNETQHAYFFPFSFSSPLFHFGILFLLIKSYLGGGGKWKVSINV